MSPAPTSKLERAKLYILAHKDESKHQQAIGAEVSEPLIALARRELVAEGKLEPGRSTKVAVAKAEVKAPKAAGVPDQPSKPAQMLDHTAMAAIADMAALTSDDVTDEEVQKKMLKQCIRFAFDPNLHPDTRMSASQMWAKLKGAQREQALGPGKPMTFESGTRRLADILLACGPKMLMAAAELAFGARDEGKVPADTGEAARSALGATATP